MEYTLTYNDSVQGWVSFYSFNPDWIIGMNNYLYTFKGGNIYRHNSNDTRNTFYQDWWTRVGTPANAFTPSRILSVFNNAPLENKLFKTINLEGDDTWSATLETDLQFSGFIDANWFQKKEQSFYAFIRNNNVGDLALRSLNGIGRSVTVVPSGLNTIVNFSIDPLVSLGNIISIGDSVYYSVPPYQTPIFAGTVTAINVNYPAGINRIIILPNPSDPPIPIQDPYFLYIKNSVAESHGVLGHYCVFDIQNTNQSKVELFAVETEVMKSFP